MYAGPVKLADQSGGICSESAYCVDILLGFSLARSPMIAGSAAMSVFEVLEQVHVIFQVGEIRVRQQMRLDLATLEDLMICAKVAKRLFTARNFFKCFLVGLLVYSVVILRVYPQSDDTSANDRNCKAVSFLTTALELQREFYMDYLNPLHDDPGFPRNEIGGSDELSIDADQYFDSCVPASIQLPTFPTICANICCKFKSYKSHGLGSSVVLTQFTVDTESCDIKDKQGQIVDAIFDDDGNPIDEEGRVLKGYDGAIWKSQYNIAKTRKNRCDSLRDQQGATSSFKDWQNQKENGKLKNFANLQLQAYEHALEPLREFRKNPWNGCKRDLSFKVPTLGGTCGGPAVEERLVVERVLASKPVAVQSDALNFTKSAFLSEPKLPQAELLNIILSNGGLGRIFTDPSPFSMPSDLNSVERNISGTCNECCSPEAVSDTAYLYGGPDGLTIVGEDSVSLGCSKGPQCGSLSGDPHLCSHDGKRFDFQGVGEYILARTDEFEVQARTKPISNIISVNSAVAVKIKGDRVALYSGEPHRLTVNGKDFELEVGDIVELPGGAVLRRDERWFRVSADGFGLEADLGRGRVGSIFVRVPMGSKSGGILGDRNDDRKDDIRPRNGKPLEQPVSFHDLYKRFGDSWRVTPEDSLFDYSEGESTETFTFFEYPKRFTSVADFNNETLAQAEEICRKAGVEGAVNLVNCKFDVALTGDSSFAQDAAAMSPSDDSLVLIEGGPEPLRKSTIDGIVVVTPAEGIASFAVEVEVENADPMYVLGFAEVRSRAVALVKNPGTSVRLEKGERKFEVRAPYEPGLYELRLVKAIPGTQEIVLSFPFRSQKPFVEIWASETVSAGQDVDIRIIGDVSPNSRLVVVPAGGSLRDAVFNLPLSGGLAQGVTFRAPRKPGKYEIRYISHTQEVIWARKPMEIR